MGRHDRCLQNVLEMLRRQIDSSFGPGERLPSERQMASMHRVAPNTIHRALMVLSAEGYVTARERAGWLRTSKGSIAHGSRGRKWNRRRPLTVGLLTRRAESQWQENEIYSALLEEAQRRNIQIVPVPNRHLHRLSSEQDRIELSRVPWNSFDVGLLVEAEGTIRMRDPLMQSRKVIAVDQDATRYGIDSVAFADVQAGEMVARHLLGLGHIRFAVTDEINEPGYPSDPAFTARRHGFEAAIGEAGGLLWPHWRMPVLRRTKPGWSAGGFRHESSHYYVKKTVAAWAALPPSQRPTALFANLAVPIVHGRLVEELASAGLNVPREFSLITGTWGGKLPAGGGEPARNGVRITSVDFDLSALVRRVFDAARELADEKPRPGGSQKPAKLYLAPAMLLMGQSTAPPPA